MKKCSKCGEEKPATTEYFYKDARQGSGLYPQCKTCRSKTQNAYEKTEQGKLRTKRSRQKNKDRVNAYNRKWHSKYGKESSAARSAKRRAIKAKVTVESFTRQDVLDKWGSDCHLCNTPVDKFDWHQDHVVPLSKGGEHSLANVKPSHPHCNLVKGNKVANLRN